jgi:alpha,alpha-trehalase
MLLEIARFWASMATHNQALDRYEIKGVVGPDADRPEVQGRARRA